MPNTRQILIVDDDLELRDALSEQLSLYEEFEAVAVENGSMQLSVTPAYCLRTRTPVKGACAGSFSYRSKRGPGSALGASPLGAGHLAPNT
jgi:hypothetical protein